PDSGWTNLRHENPRARAHTNCKTGYISQNKDQDHNARQMKMDGGRNRDEGSRHASESRHQQSFSSGAVNQEHPNNGRDKIDGADNDVCPQRRAGGLMGYMLQEHQGTVINNGVDPRELAEESNENGDDQGPAEFWIQEFSAFF